MALQGAVPQLTPAVGLAVAAFSALIAATSAIFAGCQLRQARRTASLQALQEFFKGVTERERAIAAAKGEQHALDFAIVEFMNFLEVYSSADNGKLLAGVAREIVSDKIIASILVLERHPTWGSEIGQVGPTGRAYEHLRKFMRKHKRVLDRRRAAVSNPVKHVSATDA